VTIKTRIKFLIYILMLVFFAGIFYFTLNKGKQKGIYEYVRKGFRYMDEKKFDKGLKILLAAHQKLPNSTGIKKQLVMGYIKYAVHLEREGKLGPAIKILEEAFTINGENQQLLTSLSYLYAKDGVYKMREGHLGEGRQDLEKAISLAMGSKAIRRKLSNYLYREAVNAYGQKDHNTSVLCLDSSYILWSSFDVLYMLGMLYYRESNPETAFFYWQKAAKINPKNEDLKSFLLVVSKELRLKDKMIEIETPHFDIKLYKEYDIDIDRLKDILSEVFINVGKDLNLYPTSKTQIIIYSDSDFKDIFKQPHIVRAFYDGSIRMPVVTDVKNPLFKAIIAHEYTHAVVSILTENKCAVWLNEGLACYEQSRYTLLALDHLKNFLKKDEMLSINKIIEGFSSDTNIEKTLLSYEMAFSAVDFMIDKWGWVGMRRFLKKIKEGRHYINAIDEEFLLSLKTFEEMWTNYAKKKI